MDDLDYRLIALLRTDARTPVATLAREVGASRATVRARIDRLLERGIIKGFTIVVDEESRPHAVRAVMMVEVEGKTADDVVKRLHGFPEVRTLYTTNGRWDVVAWLEVNTLEAFDEVLRRIRLVEGIASTETNILLSTRKGG